MAMAHMFYQQPKIVILDGECSKWNVPFPFSVQLIQAQNACQLFQVMSKGSVQKCQITWYNAYHHLSTALFGKVSLPVVDAPR